MMPLLRLVVMAVILVTMLYVTFAEFLDALNEHNLRRRKEAKSMNVSNLKELIYSDTLEGEARDWATRCVWNHTGKSSVQGENLFASSIKNDTEKEYVTQALDSWMAEKELNVNNTFDCCYKDTSCCHYAQVVNAKSINVGCAKVGCRQLIKPNGQIMLENANYLMCIYTPPGNIALNGTIIPYKYGLPCSECDAGEVCHDGLCAQN